MSYKDKLKSLFDEMGVKYSEDGETICVDESCGVEWSGYSGFGFCFTFDKSGKLLEVGASEG